MASASSIEMDVFGNQQDELEATINAMGNEELKQVISALDNEIKIMTSNMNTIRNDSKMVSTDTHIVVPI